MGRNLLAWVQSFALFFLELMIDEGMDKTIEITNFGDS